MKKTIIAICGASAVGKDTIAGLICSYLSVDPACDCGRIVQDTTRPRRINEIDGVDYNFIRPAEFLKKARQYKFIDYQTFRGWSYGIPLDSINHDVNIGVFNARSMNQLLQAKDVYNIIPIYLEANYWTRLKRSYLREGKFKFEFIRRGIADFNDYVDLMSRFKKLHNITVYKFRTDTIVPNLPCVIARRIINILNYSKQG